MESIVGPGLTCKHRLVSRKLRTVAPENAKTAFFQYMWLSLHVVGMITDLYIDSFKFRGRNVKGKIQQLMSVLENYTLKALQDFFSSSAMWQWCS